MYYYARSFVSMEQHISIATNKCRYYNKIAINGKSVIIFVCHAILLYSNKYKLFIKHTHIFPNAI